MKTGGHIKPCKVGDVEKHNSRDPEYVERMKTSKHPLNFYPDLALRSNQNWKNEEREVYLDKTTRKPLKVAQVFDQMIAVYTEHDKRHRRPPLKERERFNPKTGKMKTIAGWSPIREMVVVTKSDTKLQDFDKVKAWFAKHGVGTMFLSLQFDEGHLDEQGNLKPNNHAHMGLDFFDWSTGKTVKLGPAKMKELQTVLADALGMERGEIKDLTGMEHLEVVEQRTEAKKKEIMPKLMKFIGGSDKEALETAQAIIQEERQKASRLLTAAVIKNRKADQREKDLDERESAIDGLINAARADERKMLQPVVDKWKEKYDVQVNLNHHKNDQLKNQRDTIQQQNHVIDELKTTVKDKQSLIDLLKNILVQPLIDIFKRVMNTIGHRFEDNDAGFVKSVISADSHAQERENANSLWKFVTEDLGIRTHTAWMSDTKKSLDRLADEGWVQRGNNQQSNQMKI